MKSDKKGASYVSSTLIAALLVLSGAQYFKIRELRAELESLDAKLVFRAPAVAKNFTGSAPKISSGLESIHDARTRKLFDEMGEILAASKTGEVNPLFQAKAWDVLLDNDAERRSRNFGFLLDALRPEDTLALHEMFHAAHREGRDFPEEYARFATRWGQVDGKGALNFYFAPGQATPAPSDVHNVLKGWAESNPQDALNWAVENRKMVMAASHPGLGEQDDPVNGVIRGWARKDVAAATEAMRKKCTNPDALARATFTIGMESLFGHGIESTLDWVKSLPATADDRNGPGKAVATEVFRKIRDSGLEAPKAAEQVLKIAEQPWYGMDDFIETSRIFRGRAAEFSAALNSGKAHDIMQGKFSSWSKENPDSVAIWLNANPSSALYDTGAAELAKNLVSTDAEAAAAWAKKIKNPATRTAAGF